MMVTPQLDTLESTGLLRIAQLEPELEYLFRHGLVQDAAYNSLLYADRKRLHRAAGETLERLYPDQLTSRALAPVLGQHFCAAGDNARALKYFTLAGDAATSVYANAEAVAHYGQALEIAARADAPGVTLEHLYSRRGRALELVGQHQQAWRNYQDMEQIGRERGDRKLELAALTAQAVLCSTPTPLHNMAQAETLLGRASELANELADRAAQARVLWLHMLRIIHGPYEPENSRQAIDYGEQSLAIARELNLREQMAFALNDLATAYTWADDIGRAASVCEQAITLWRELGNLPMLTDGLLNAAGNAGYNEAYVRTLDLADEAFQIAASIGNVWSQSSSLSYQALAYVELGQAGQALAAYRASTELSQQAGFVQSQTRAQAHWGRLCGELGDVGRGLALVQQACQEGSGYTSGLLGMMICRLSLLTQAGDLDAAAALLAEMYHNFSRETLRTMLDMSPVEAEFLLAKGDFGEVMGLVDEMLAYFDRVHISKYRTYLLYLKAQALRKLDRLDEAWVILSHAHAEGEAKSLRWYLWRTLAALGEMEAQRGNSMEAQTLRRQAREIIDYIADDLARFAPAAEQDLRAAFLNKPDVRAILEQANE